jgi:hypothetical protein
VIIVKNDSTDRTKLILLAKEWGLLPQICASTDEAKICLDNLHYDILWLNVDDFAQIEFAANIKSKRPGLKIIGVSSCGSRFTGEHHFDRIVCKPILDYDVLESTIALIGETRLCETFRLRESQSQSLSFLQYQAVLITNECHAVIKEIVQQRLTDLVSQSKVLPGDTVVAWLDAHPYQKWHVIVTTSRDVAQRVLQKFKNIQCILISQEHVDAPFLATTPRLQETSSHQIDESFLRAMLQLTAQSRLRKSVD